MSVDSSTSAGQERVLLLAPPNSYRLAAYLRAARSLGIDLVVASAGEHSLIAEVADGLHLDPGDPQDALAHIVAFAASRPLHGILASDDATVELAALAAQALGLPANPPEATRLARRKDLARAHLQAAGVPVPAHRLVDLGRELAPQLAGFPLPAVAKPVSLSASRGVIRADTLDELLAACETITGIVADLEHPDESGYLLLEAYIDGVEVAADGLLGPDGLQPLALFDKPEPLVGPYFEESYYVTPSRLDAGVQRAVWRTIAAACDSYGLRHGPVHAELRITAAGPVILEVAARTIGGECARMFDRCLTVGLESLALSAAVGRPPMVTPPDRATGVLMIPIPRAGVLRRVDGIEAAAAVPGVSDVRITAAPGHELQTLPDAASYLGFIFADAETPAAVEGALRQAHDILDIKIDPLWRIA
jgi:biotin carboxylase